MEEAGQEDPDENTEEAAAEDNCELGELPS